MTSESLGALSLPEAMALIGGENVDVHEVVYLALLELVVRGAVELVSPSRAQDEYRLRPRDRSRIVARPLAAIFDLIGEACADDPRVNTDSPANKYVQRRFAARWGLAGAYVRLEVWWTLKARGLCGPSAERQFAQIWDLSTSGKAERERILACGTKADWRDRPATTLLQAAGLAIPRDETFDILDEIEEQITPAADYNLFDTLTFGPTT